MTKLSVIGCILILGCYSQAQSVCPKAQGQYGCPSVTSKSKVNIQEAVKDGVQVYRFSTENVPMYDLVADGRAYYSKESETYRESRTTECVDGQTIRTTFRYDILEKGKVKFFFEREELWIFGLVDSLKRRGSWKDSSGSVGITNPQDCRK